jgi:hypothetical protein
MRAESPKNDKRHAVSVTDLTKFIKEEHIKLLTEIATSVFTLASESKYNLDIPCKLKITTEETDLWEDVSDINGIVIPAIYESESQNAESTIEKQVHQYYDNLCRQQNKHNFIHNAYIKLNKYGSMQTTDDYIRMGIMYISLSEEIYHKIAQITIHNWLNRELIQPCFTVLGSLIDTSTALYERGLECEQEFAEFGKIEFKGRLDVFDERCVLEIKCVQALTLEHKMQLLIYAWMWKKQTDRFYTSKEFKLVNIRTGEVYILDTCSHLIDDAIRILLKNKYEKRDTSSDSEFIEMCTSAASAGITLSAASALSKPSGAAPCTSSSNKCLIVDMDDDDNPVNIL